MNTYILRVVAQADVNCEKAAKALKELQRQLWSFEDDLIRIKEHIFEIENAKKEKRNDSVEHI